MFAAMISTDYAKKDAFRKNFMASWRPLLKETKLHSKITVTPRPHAPPPLHAGTRACRITAARVHGRACGARAGAGCRLPGERALPLPTPVCCARWVGQRCLHVALRSPLSPR